jgi:hypothetical protein
MRAAALQATLHLNSTEPGQDHEVADTIKRQSARVPVALDADGRVSAWQARPEIGFFGDDGPGGDPRHQVAWNRIGELIGVGRRRGLLNVGRFIGEAIQRAAEAREAGRNE